MATIAKSFQGGNIRTTTRSYPAGSLRFDWFFTLLSTWVIFGLYIDGWAHNHGQVDNTFFTPWHALLYLGVLSIGVFLFVNQWANLRKGYPLMRALPQGYTLSLIGAGLFMMGGGFDFVWHSIVGFEVDLETLLSPAHTLLATSAGLMISGPIRAAWGRTTSGKLSDWRIIGPALLCLTLCFSLFTFFTNFASPISTAIAAVDPAPNNALFSDLYVMNSDGTGQTRLNNEAGASFWGGVWSPDGTQVVFSKGDATTENNETSLYLMNADGTNQTQLTNLPGSEYRASWSPDGAQLVFVYKADESSNDLYLVDTAGGTPQALTETDYSEYGPVWSPNGDKILFASDQTGTLHLYSINVDGSSAGQLTTEGANNWGANWSPDGSQIVFHSDRGNNTSLFVMNADGSDLTRLTHDAWDITPAFSPDGARIIFKSWRNDFSDIYTLDAACISQPNTCDETIVNLTNNLALDTIFPEFSPDGSKILFSANGYDLRSPFYLTQSLGIASIMLQAAFLMGIILLALKQWRLPFGALTLIIALNVALMTVWEDTYALIPVAIGIGLAAELLLAVLKPTPERRGQFYLFAFLTPVLFYAAYFVAIQVSSGLGWTMHVWMGTIVFAGLVGLLMSFLLLPPFEAKTPAV